MKQTGYDNRELSWLKFNERVLEEAENEEFPLCERLFFLSVFQSNQDEFFMVRVGALWDQQSVSADIRENKTYMTAKEQLTAITDQVRRLNDRRDRIWRILSQQLRQEGMDLVELSELKSGEEEFLKEYFEREIRPVLSPQIVGKRQPFPFLAGGELYVTVTLETRGNSNKLGLIPCGGRFFDRLIALPGSQGRYILAEEVILHFAPLVFDKYRVKRGSLLRVTRSADMAAELAADLADEKDYREFMEDLIWRRTRRCAVRMELSQRWPAPVVGQLCRYLGLEKSQVFYCRTPLELSFVQEIRHLLRDRPPLFFEKRIPSKLPQTVEEESIWQQAQKGDILLSYPYESMKPFLQMLQEAAEDPEVLSVKITLYRLAQGSKVADALMEAAENGKEVLVLLELGARFDEENNIEWSRRLEAAGCRVLYGLEGFKVHCKLCLITARRKGQLACLTQIGSGNYNEKTARQYTDLSYITADEEIGAEAGRIFSSLCMGQAPEGCGKLLVSPCTLQKGILEQIDAQARAAREGKGGYIGMKMNSLTDRKIIQALMEASAAGVMVELIVRGSCCIVGGIAGKTENVRVISIVGRFLEHSRFYLFGRGEEQQIYFGSADLMTRNTMRRVEVLAPVKDEACRERLRRMFTVLWNDTENCWEQQADGSYVKRRRKEWERRVDAQDGSFVVLLRTENPAESDPFSKASAEKQWEGAEICMR